MKILLINKFLYPKGGDAISTIETGKLLQNKGHIVFFWGMKSPNNPPFLFDEYFVEEINYEGNLSLRIKLASVFNLMYSLEAKHKIAQLIKIVKPDVVHLNNFAHQISPSILDVFCKFRIPMVMTMRDYKLVCPSYSMLADGKPCERCKNGRYYFCFLKKCTKNSFLKSFVNTVEMYLHHKILHVYDKIDTFIAPSKFMLNKVREMGFKKKIVYLPNFVDIEEFKPQYEWEEESIVYMGRLSYEKGVVTLIDAVKGIPIKLKIIGDGPLRETLISKAEGENIDNVEFLGYKTSNELKKLVKKSMFTVLPSECYENSPRVVLESFALGKPVIGARIGGIPELVMDEETGLTFEAGDRKDLKEKIMFLINSPNRIIEMGKNARKFAVEKFNSDRYYSKLMQIYQAAKNKIR